MVPTMHDRQEPVRRALTAILVLAIPALARATPITLEAPLVLEAGQVAVATQGSLVWAPDGPAPEGADEQIVGAALAVMVGALPRTTLAATVPFADKRSSIQVPGGEREERHARGIGDATFTAAVAAVPGAVVPFVGVKAPTGSSDQADSLGRFPQRFQVGTGAWDATAGVLFSRCSPLIDLDAALSYSLGGTAHDFDAGDEVRGELSARRRLAGPLVGALETRIAWRQADGGALAPAESGGATWTVAPGLQGRLGRHTIEAAVEIPLVQPVDRHVSAVARVGYRVLFEGGA
jgi:hypothetical protein